MGGGGVADGVGVSLPSCWLTASRCKLKHALDTIYPHQTHSIFSREKNIFFSVVSADLIVGVINIALPFSQVHRLRLDSLVPAKLWLAPVVGVATILVGGSGAVATVGNVHMHRIEFLYGRVDVVPQGGGGSCRKSFISMCHCDNIVIKL